MPALTPTGTPISSPGASGRRAYPNARSLSVRAAAAATSSTASTKKHAIITGANTGIGLEIAKALASTGDYDVTLACRDAAKADAAAATVRAAGAAAGATGAVATLALDLASLASVRAAAARLLDGGRPIDVLVNNAGIMALPDRQTTADGFERQLGVNHLGPFLLTSTLLPLLADPATPSRIVNLASSAHQFAPKGMPWSDIQSEQNYSAWGAYGASKLANILHVLALSASAPASARLTATACHPGVVRTELARHLVDPASAGFLQRVALALTYPFLKTPAQGAATPIYLASSPEVEGISGRYFSNCKPVKASDAAYDLEAAKKLWELSASLTEAPGVPW
jgi:NAD(P)-dependent dehydrogenase (short-subunit alcohol dehydrogenase family)